MSFSGRHIGQYAGLALGPAEPPFSSEDETYGCRDGLDSESDLSVEVRDSGPGEASPGVCGQSAMIIFCVYWRVDRRISQSRFS